MTKRRITKRNRIKRKYSKKRTKTRHSRKRVFSKKRRKTIKKKKRGGMSFTDLFTKKEPVKPVISVKGELIAERYRKKEVQKKKKQQKELDLNIKKMKEEKIEKNLEEIEKLIVDEKNVNDKIDNLMNDYETVDNIVNENIQTIKDFESNFVKEKILNFINKNGDKIKFKLYLIKEAEKRIKESEGEEISATKGGLPITHPQNAANEYPNYKPGNPSYVQDFQNEHHNEEKGNGSSSNNYDVKQDKKDLTEYKNDYFTIMLKIKEIIKPYIIENEIERIKNENEKIKDDINKIDKKYNIK